MMWGVNGIAKRKEVVDAFRKGKFELIGLTETKLEGNGEVSWYRVDGIIRMFKKLRGVGEVWPLW